MTEFLILSIDKGHVYIKYILGEIKAFMVDGKLTYIILIFISPSMYFMPCYAKIIAYFLGTGERVLW